MVESVTITRIAARIRQATGVAGPNLTNVALRPTLAGEQIPNTPETLARWIHDPPAVDAKTAMPNLGVKDEDLKDIACYLYTLR